MARGYSTPPTVAIVGAGVTGLYCAWRLQPRFSVTIFERHGRPGGHTDTHTVGLPDGQCQVDSGFIIYSPSYYPNFCRMLDDLDITSNPTDMSMSVHNLATGLIYNPANLSKLLSQPMNAFKPGFYRMLLSLLRFYRHAERQLEELHPDTTIQDYLKLHGYAREFATDHLMPMMSALWSATSNDIKAFPARHLIDFFSRHGLLKLTNRAQWRTLDGGSQRYVRALQKKLDVNWQLSNPVLSVERAAQHVKIKDSHRQKLDFDYVILACHAPQSLKLLSDASNKEQQVLASFRVQKNTVTVHTDCSVMPPIRRSWASWNTIVPPGFDRDQSLICSATYWMNSLQNLATKTPIFTTLNDPGAIDPTTVLKVREYQHPIFDAKSVAAQPQLHRINGQNNTYFAGAWTGWGFHEDGARSAEDVSKRLIGQLESAA